MVKSFKDTHPFENRRDEAERMLEKYPDRIPCIIEKHYSSKLPDIDKKKFLVPTDLSVGQLIHVVRKRITIPSEMAIFLLINNTMPASSHPLSTVYEQHKAEDKFLYCVYNGENTFGNK